MLRFFSLSLCFPILTHSLTHFHPSTVRCRLMKQPPVSRISPDLSHPSLFCVLSFAPYNRRCHVSVAASRRTSNAPIDCVHSREKKSRSALALVLLLYACIKTQGGGVVICSSCLTVIDRDEEFIVLFISCWEILTISDVSFVKYVSVFSHTFFLVRMFYPALFKFEFRFLSTMQR